MNSVPALLDIFKCLKFLDERLKGTKVSELTDKLINMKPLLEKYLNDYNNLYNTLMKVFIDFASKRSEIIGKENLLSQPEFSDDANELKKLFGLFDNPVKLEEIIKNADELLLIDDNEDDESIKNEVSIVTKEVVLPGDESIGKIAVIGPKRMDYSKVINYVNYIVSEIIAHMNK